MLIHLLADSAPANSVAVIFNSLGGLGGFVVAVIGVLIFIRDNKKKPRRRNSPRKRASGATNDHRSGPSQRNSEPKDEEPSSDDEISEDENGSDADGGYTRRGALDP